MRSHPQCFYSHTIRRIGTDPFLTTRNIGEDINLDARKIPVIKFGKILNWDKIWDPAIILDVVAPQIVTTEDWGKLTA